MKLNIEVNCSYVCEPIHKQDGSLLAVELLSRFSAKSVDLSMDVEQFIRELGVEGKTKLFHDQLRAVKTYSEWFIANNVLLSINIDFDLASVIVSDDSTRRMMDEMPFLRLEIMETFSNLSDGMNNPLLRELAGRYPLWLDDLGSGGSTLNAVTANIFEYVKIDKHFFWQHNKHTFPILINNIKKYCLGVIVVGVENQDESAQLKGSNIDAMQGYLFHPLTLDELVSQPR
ncbi:EAL domain-containing protein [Yersinia enterocolitica]|jgi:EAL domain-containing protein (putative c-di-GMP-specific phosphodiesterase class I)|uniref:Cyclic diguanylate phosphodiesterase domain-containing protein n=1 Tax=Yersinia frederiksenii TaxID=29484 RepID=A0AAI8ZR01_YERFR|nr:MULTISPECIES: EAL domain-containing protein [Yersinia]MDN0127340.1 EAL domain-containing protein [Yersinia massiliensis]CFR00471.1 cyclic diguanylate phosphodiesterase domain-containing protein [Yersinia frederiksenii]CFR16590.1 cyclic diguanylate phosphodiesterase domain-containing protein [Yersinia frederiksenii]HEI6965067.1 EAL domain-containing protein [Yersinia enterocolitica]